MKRSMTFACLLAALCAWAVLDSTAQTTLEAQASASPVAYVYVSSPSPNSYGLIYAYRPLLIRTIMLRSRSLCTTF